MHVARAFFQVIALPLRRRSASSSTSSSSLASEPCILLDWSNKRDSRSVDADENVYIWNLCVSVAECRAEIANRGEVILRLKVPPHHCI